MNPDDVRWTIAEVERLRDTVEHQSGSTAFRLTPGQAVRALALAVRLAEYARETLVAVTTPEAK